MAVKKSFNIDLSLRTDGILTVQQVVLNNKPAISVGDFPMTYEEWNALCALQPLMVTPHVVVPAPPAETEEK